MKSLIEEVVSRQTEDTRIECPLCGPDRKKHNTKTLSVSVLPHETLYKCHHCEAGGIVFPEDLSVPIKPFKKKISQIPTPINADNATIEKWFASRGITLTDMSKLPVMITGRKFFHGHGELPAIGFVYGDRNQPDAIKWRAFEKKAFTQDNAARTFYGLELLAEAPKEIIIVEGEADAVALCSIGIPAVSVPNGAPMKVSGGRISPEEDRKFKYLWDSKEIFDSAGRIVLACDGDPAGDALAEEIARRIGRERAYRAVYPEGCKDITDVIREHGPVVAKQVIETAEALPLVGVYTAKDYRSQLMDVYHEGVGHGESTGYPELDKIWTIKTGQVTVVTGVPNSGKSSFVDAIMMNLAQRCDWKFAISSFENPPHIHLAKLSELHAGKPFFSGPNPRQTKADLEGALDFIDDHFIFLESKDGSMSTIDSVLARFRAAIYRTGARGALIDPYNYLDLGHEESEHHAISNMLTKVTNFAKAHDVHIFFVAHPTKLYPRDDGSMPIPKGQHVSGSSAWFSKADCGITVHRTGGSVEIHSWKCRFKWIGAQGTARLQYDLLTGRYSEYDPANDSDLDDFGDFEDF